MDRNLIASAIAGAIVLASGCQSEKLYKFPEFKSVEVNEKDPVAQEAKKFFDEYQAAVKADSENAQHNFDSTYNRFVVRVKPFVALPEASFSDGGQSYFLANEKLNVYLIKKGWLFRINDTFVTNEQGEQRPIRFLVLGKVHSLRNATVIGLDKKPIHYQEIIISDARQTKTHDQTFRFTSFTEATTVYHFLDEYAKMADNVERDLSEDRDELSVQEWSGIFAKFGGGTKFNTIVLSDLLRGSSMHEREHVIDYELSAMRSTKEYAAVLKIKLLMEIRGLLAQIAHSGTEIYGFSHAFDWADSSETVNRLAGDTVVNVIGIPPKDEFDPRRYLRDKALQELQKSDEIVLSALKFKDDPDPVDRARRSHEDQK